MIEKYRIKGINDVHEFVRMLIAEAIQAALDANLEYELSYFKYDYKNKQTTEETVIPKRRLKAA